MHGLTEVRRELTVALNDHRKKYVKFKSRNSVDKVYVECAGILGKGSHRTTETRIMDKSDLEQSQRLTAKYI